MSSIVPQGGATGSGINNLVAPASNNNNTQTLPDKSGTLAMDGPAFSAYGNTNQTVTGSTFTKVVLNTKEFDTASAFDATTNYRFQPLVAGYYQINGQVNFVAVTNVTRALVAIYKNGSVYKWGNDYNATTAINAFRGVVSCIVYFNGSTDYVELYGYMAGSGTLSFNATGTPADCYLSGSFVRGA